MCPGSAAIAAASSFSISRLSVLAVGFAGADQAQLAAMVVGRLDREAHRQRRLAQQPPTRLPFRPDVQPVGGRFPRWPRRREVDKNGHFARRHELLQQQIQRPAGKRDVAAIGRRIRGQPPQDFLVGGDDPASIDERRPYRGQGTSLSRWADELVAEIDVRRPWARSWPGPRRPPARRRRNSSTASFKSVSAHVRRRICRCGRPSATRMRLNISIRLPTSQEETQRTRIATAAPTATAADRARRSSAPAASGDRSIRSTNSTGRTLFCWTRSSPAGRSARPRRLAMHDESPNAQHAGQPQQPGKTKHRHPAGERLRQGGKVRLPATDFRHRVRREAQPHRDGLRSFRGQRLGRGAGGDVLGRRKGRRGGRRMARRAQRLLGQSPRPRRWPPRSRQSCRPFATGGAMTAALFGAHGAIGGRRLIGAA